MTSSTPSPASPPSSSLSSGSRDGSVLGIDPLTGLSLDLDARTPHHHSPDAHNPHDHDGPQTSGGFMRLVWVEDLTVIEQAQAATMLASLRAGHIAEHSAPLPQGVRGMITTPVIVTDWEATVTEPPSPKHHVLVATTTQVDAASRTIVDLLDLVPTWPVDAGRYLDETRV